MKLTSVSDGWKEHCRYKNCEVVYICVFFFSFWLLLTSLRHVCYILFYVLQNMTQAKDTTYSPNILVITSSSIWKICTIFTANMVPYTNDKHQLASVTSKLSQTTSESLAAHPFTMQFVMWASWQSQKYSFTYSEWLQDTISYTKSMPLKLVREESNANFVISIRNANLKCACLLSRPLSYN